MEAPVLVACDHRTRFEGDMVLTADAERPSRSRALAGGANDFLVKPFDAEEALLRVRNLVEARRLHRALRTRNATLVAEVAARTSDLQESEARWAGVIASLSKLTALATPEATAESICESLAALPGSLTTSSCRQAATFIPITIQRSFISCT